MENSVWVLIKEDGDGEFIALDGVFSTLEKATESATKKIKQYLEDVSRRNGWELPYIVDKIEARKAKVNMPGTPEFRDSETLYDIGYEFHYAHSDVRYFSVQFLAELTEIDKEYDGTSL